MKIRIALLFIILFVSNSCNKQNTIIYCDNIAEVFAREVSNDNKTPFSVIITNDHCGACDAYIAYLSQNTYKASYYILNISSPENQWLHSWLFESGTPITCVFSSPEKLIGIFRGFSPEYIKMTNLQCESTFDYIPSRFPFDNRDTAYSFLSKTLKAKLMIDEGKDMHKLLEETIKTFSYPFNTYLMAKNEANNHREKQAKLYAQKVLDNISTYSLIYCTRLREEMKYIIDPQFDILSEPLLTTENNVPIGECNKDAYKEILLNIHNQGKKTLTIYDVRNSCDCIDIQWDTLSVPENQIKTLKIKIKPKNTGFIEETIYIFSNARNSMVLTTLTGVAK